MTKKIKYDNLIHIPVSADMKRRLEQTANDRQTSIATIARQALKQALPEERRNAEE